MIFSIKQILKKPVAWAAILCLLLGAIVIVYGNQKTIPTVIIGGRRIVVEVPASGAQMERGLGYRDALEEGQGMLFVYDDYIVPRFWMKGMKFPLDIIWIKDNIVAGFEKNVPIPSGENYPIYQPKDFINKVLEVNAGFVDESGLKIGDRVEMLRT